MKKNISKLRNLIIIALSIVPISVQAFDNPSPGLFATFGLTEFSVTNVLLFVVNRILLPIVGLISLFFIIVGGFRYITSAGNEEQAESGKKTLTNAIIGLVIVILSYTIVLVVMHALEGSV